jgi:hypothetical protein
MEHVVSIHKSLLPVATSSTTSGTDNLSSMGEADSRSGSRQDERGGDSSNW